MALLEKVGTIIKPTADLDGFTNLNFANKAAISAMGLTTVIAEESLNDPKPINVGNLGKNTKSTDSQSEMNLLDFSRLYKIGGIPVIDFILVYVLLFIANKLYLDFNYKIILVATIPITIIFELIISQGKIKLSFILILILIISIFYLLFANYHD